MKTIWITSGPLILLCWHLWRELQIARVRLANLEARSSTHPGEDTSGSSPALAGIPLSPHFLFNALNTIRYFVRTNTSTARDLLLDLSQVLQAALRTERRAVLREEIESGRAYLRLESARLGERLQVIDQLEVENTDLLVSARVLGPLLQSLVGAVSARNQGGTIRLTMQGRVLVLEADGEAPICTTLLEDFSDTISVYRSETTRVEWRTQS